MTRACSIPPPLDNFSQKQPPGRASIERFFASPEYVCCESHHEPICPMRASYTFAAGALTLTSNFSKNPFWLTCGVDCAVIPESTTRASVPNEHRRMIAAPGITQLSRFPSLRYISRIALCCYTMHGDGTLFERH